MTDTTNTRHWGPAAHFLGLSIWERVSYVSRIYRNTFPKIVCILLLAFGLGVWFNTSGHKEWNVILMFLTMALWAFLTFHPKGLFHVFAWGAFKGLPDFELDKVFKEFDLPNFKRDEVLKAAVDEFKRYVYLTAHAALFWTAAFAVLSLFDLKNGWAAYGILGFLAALGLRSVVYQAPAKIYRFMTGLILTFGLLASVVSAYRYMHPQDETTARIERAQMVRSDKVKEARAQELLAKSERGEELTFDENEELSRFQAERTGHGMLGEAKDGVYDAIGWNAIDKVVEVRSFANQLVCGLRPGQRDVTIPYQQIRLNGGDYTLSGIVMINGSAVQTAQFKGPSSTSVRVNDSGCVRLSFNLTAEMRNMRIQPQQLNMTFK